MKNIKFLSTIVIFLTTLAISVPVYAAEKDYTFSIAKDYNAGKISIELPDAEYEYNISAKSPDGKKYTANSIDDYNQEIVINEALKKGEWSVHVERTSSEEQTEDNKEESEINVKLKFEGSMEMIKDVSKEITVASDIVGLSMYFKDDSFVAEWTDTTIGNVDIEVTDEKTSESLGKETVQNRYYELPLDEKVESIIVKIVPSVSAREEGAEKYFTYKFDNHPAAKVEYEDIKITNKNEIGVHITVEDNSYKAMMMNNGKEISITETLSPGEYDFTIPTEVGDNNYLVYIIDEAGNMRSTAGYVKKDVVAPILQLEKEYVNLTTQEESIDIEGKVEDYDYFTINDADVKVEGDHTFKYTYGLKEGINAIEIVASDEAGNVSSYTATVTRIIPVEEPIPWLKIVLIVSIIGLAVIYIFDVIKKNGGTAGANKGKTSKKESSNQMNTKGLVFDILGLAIPCAIIYIVFEFVIGISVIQSGSMEPALMTGDTLFFNRLYYKTGHTPQRGDIITCESKEMGLVIGKRVIGIPGDHIEFRDGYVVVNGQYLDESDYIDPDVETNCSKTFDVPDGCYFLLGDNRENSEDSRFWNNPYIPLNDFMGIYMGNINFSIQYDIINKLNK